jgi:hypothetical protein
MGMYDNLDFSKATEQRQNTPDGDYEVTILGSYTSMSRGGGGAYAFVEYRIDSGPLASTEAAWRQQSLNDSTAKALVGYLAAGLGYVLTIPEHKAVFDQHYPPEILKATIERHFNCPPPGNQELRGKRCKLTIRTKITRNQRPFREHIWAPLT